MAVDEHHETISMRERIGDGVWRKIKLEIIFDHKKNTHFSAFSFRIFNAMVNMHGKQSNRINKYELKAICGRRFVTCRPHWVGIWIRDRAGRVLNECGVELFMEMKCVRIEDC